MRTPVALILCAVTFVVVSALGGDALAAAATATATGQSPGALGNSGLGAAMFWLFAFGTVGGAIFVITRRNLIVAVMGMVGTFFAIAALYVMLYAHFMAVIQILVYAGAIMVLFVFVIMILNKEEESPWSTNGLVGKVLAFAGLSFLVYRVGGVLWDVSAAAPAAVGDKYVIGGALWTVSEGAAALGPQTTADAFGSTRAMGQELFSGYIFPFEAVSVVLLVAVVGAIAVARPAVQASAKRELEEGKAA